MPVEIFHGTDPHDVMTRARQSLGPDAMVLEVRRTGGGFELLASDAESPPVPRVRRARIPDPRHPELELAAHRRVALVGPTGAGKTTTLAKLLARDRRARIRAGALTLDTFRAGAVEQLRALAGLFRARVAVAHTPADLAPAVRNLRGSAVVYVDTAGRGPERDDDDRETWQMLSALQPDEVHLVVPAGIHPRRARRLIHAYQGRGVTHLLVTKLDEHREEVTWFELAAEMRVAMRWVAFGQGIDRDLGPASEWRVAGARQGTPSARVAPLPLALAPLAPGNEA